MDDFSSLQYAKIIDSLKEYSNKPQSSPYNNEHLRLMADAAKVLLKSKRGVSFPDKDSTYSQIIQETLQNCLKRLLVSGDLDGEGLCAALIKGSFAFSTANLFLNTIENQLLPEQTLGLFRLIYAWLFAFIGKSPEYANLRFLDPGFTSTLEIILLFDKPPQFSNLDYRNSIRNELIDLLNFSPPVEVEIRLLGSFSLPDAISSFILFDNGSVQDLLKTEIPQLSNE